MHGGRRHAVQVDVGSAPCFACHKGGRLARDCQTEAQEANQDRTNERLALVTAVELVAITPPAAAKRTLKTQKTMKKNLSVESGAPQ